MSLYPLPRVECFAPLNRKDCQYLYCSALYVTIPMTIGHINFGIVLDSGMFPVLKHGAYGVSCVSYSIVYIVLSLSYSSKGTLHYSSQTRGLMKIENFARSSAVRCMMRIIRAYPIHRIGRGEYQLLCSLKYTFVTWASARCGVYAFRGHISKRMKFETTMSHQTEQGG